MYRDTPSLFRHRHTPSSAHTVIGTHRHYSAIGTRRYHARYLHECSSGIIMDYAHRLLSSMRCMRIQRACASSICSPPLHRRVITRVVTSAGARFLLSWRALFKAVRRGWQYWPFRLVRLTPNGGGYHGG